MGTGTDVFDGGRGIDLIHWISGPGTPDLGAGTLVLEDTKTVLAFEMLKDRVRVRTR